MKTLMHFVRPYRRQLLLVLAALGVNLVGVLMVPTLLAQMINVGVSSRDLDFIYQQAAVMLAMAFVSGAGAFVCNWFCADLATKVGRDIRDALYDASLAFSSSDFERFGTGSMITRTLNDVNVIQQGITMAVQMMLPVPFAAVIGIVLASMIDVQMGVLLAGFILLVSLLAVATVRRASRIFQRLQRFIDRMNTRLRESITGVRVIRAFGKEAAERESLDEAFSDYAASAIKVNWIFATFDCSTFFIMNLAEVAVIWLGGNRVGAHAMGIASISACVEYAMMVLFYIMMAQIGALMLPRSLVCLERVREVIEHKPSIVDGPRAELPADASASDIVASFKNASFRFADASEDTLHHLNFACRRGTTTAIIGPTGSGKSTVAKLLLRLHDVTDGSVEVDGEDVRNLTQEGLRGRISYVPQKAWLFSGTIADNLRYGNPGATDGELWHAIDVAQGSFARELADGLESRVAQGGTNFSGGQRQRLAIARALAKPADLYIFDDSFSALDFKTDAALRHALSAEIGRAAVLIIAQRVNTILNADQIIVLKDGRIEGLGTHRELMRTCASYREIARSQLRADELDGLTGALDGTDRLMKEGE